MVGVWLTQSPKAPACFTPPNLKIHRTIEIGTLMDQLPSAPTCAARVEGLPCLASAE